MSPAAPADVPLTDLLDEMLAGLVDAIEEAPTVEAAAAIVRHVREGLHVSVLQDEAEALTRAAVSEAEPSG